MSRGDVGDLIFTKFFGEPPRAGIILEVNRNPYGIVSYLTVLSCGKQLFFRPDQIILPEDIQKYHE
jgi:hypothetical protein